MWWTSLTAACCGAVGGEVCCTSSAVCCTSWPASSEGLGSLQQGGRADSQVAHHRAGLDGSGAGSPVCLPDAGSRVPGPGSERGGAAARTAAAAAAAVAAAAAAAAAVAAAAAAAVASIHHQILFPNINLSACYRLVSGFKMSCTCSFPNQPSFLNQYDNFSWTTRSLIYHPESSIVNPIRIAEHQCHPPFSALQTG